MQNTRFTTSMKTENPKVIPVTAPNYMERQTGDKVLQKSVFLVS